MKKLFKKTKKLSVFKNNSATNCHLKDEIQTIKHSKTNKIKTDEKQLQQSKTKILKIKDEKLKSNEKPFAYYWGDVFNAITSNRFSDFDILFIDHFHSSLTFLMEKQKSNLKKTLDLENSMKFAQRSWPKADFKNDDINSRLIHQAENLQQNLDHVLTEIKYENTHEDARSIEIQNKLVEESENEKMETSIDMEIKSRNLVDDHQNEVCIMSFDKVSQNHIENEIINAEKAPDDSIIREFLNNHKNPSKLNSYKKNNLEETPKNQIINHQQN